MSLKQVMDAIASVETNGGKNGYPRFERAYAPVGQGFTIQGHVIQGTGVNWNPLVERRWRMWGMASACSFSRWQILAHTAWDRGMPEVAEPWRLWNDAAAQPWVVMEINRQFKRGATVIEKMARAWNGGNPNANVPQEYIERMKAAYQVVGGDPAAPLDITS